jgi:hypothetical protein
LAYEKLNKYSQALKDYSIVLMLGDYLKFKVRITIFDKFYANNTVE